MNKALFAALASVALLGASCSVQDFTPVVLSKPTITASFDFDAPKAEITTMDELEDYYGKYSFRYGYLSDNRCNFDAFNIQTGTGAYFVKRVDNDLSIRISGSWNGVYFPCDLVANREYSLRFSCNQPFVNVAITLSNDDNEYGYQSISTVTDGTYYYSTFTPNGAKKYLRIWLNADVDYVIGGVMVSEGGSSKPYQPYGIGMTYETPLSGARSAMYTLDGNGDINSRLVYTDNLAYPELRDFMVYFDSMHWMLDNDTYEAFNVSLSEALSDATMRNIDGFDYDRDGTYDLMWTVENPYDAYLEFEIGSPLPDRYKDTMLDGLESLYYKLDDGTTTATGYLSPSSLLFDAMDGLLINGLLDVQGFKDWLIDRQSVTFSGGVSMNLNFNYGLNGKELGAAPVYVDNRSYASTTDLALMPEVSASAVINLGHHWVCFSLDLNTTYAGNATSYNGEYATIGDKTYYRDLSIFTPRNQSANELRYVGVLSSYARGYADGVASRDGEVDDLTERILSLEEDLTQYQGKSYQQIYDLGKQAGMNLATNAGAATFNSLFGNILTAPLTILNGLMPMEFFGMPILTAILSLLMVALALWLFKRFK